eukprot:jgi/Tetstr1/427773/TSEL_017891.t1
MPISTVSSLGGSPQVSTQDQRLYQEELLHALGEWWDEVGFATAPDKATYAPKYQVVCKETVQKLLYSWLQRQELRSLYPAVTCLCYQEFASKLGEPALWQKWWNAKVAPASGVGWGPRGQWCRLYRLHNALPPFVRLRTLSAEDAVGARPRSSQSPWLMDQLMVLRALEDYWEEVGLVLSPSSRGAVDDGSFIGGDVEDESFSLHGGPDATEKSSAVLTLDISAIEPNVDQTAIHDVSVDDINGLDTSDLNLEYWSEQLTNHRDLVQGLHDWIHSDSSRRRMYKSAASIDKYTFRAHLNQVWPIWWASKVEPKCGVPWGSCGRFNRRLRLPPYVRMKEHVNEACPVDFSEIMEPSQLGLNTSFGSVGPSALDTHRSMVRSALLDALRDWWSTAGLVLRPDQMSEAMRREQTSDCNVSKQKIQILLYRWLRTQSVQSSHPVAASVKFRALASMLGYLWGRWWDSCVAPVAGIRWGGSGRFSNKGVLPPFVRLCEGFSGSDRELRAYCADSDLFVGDTDSDIFGDFEGDAAVLPLDEDSLIATNHKFSHLDLSASVDMLNASGGSWASASFYRSASTPLATRPSGLRREARSSPLSPLCGEQTESWPATSGFFPSASPVLDDGSLDSPLSSPTSVLDISLDTKYLHPGLLEVLDGVDSDEEDELDCPDKYQALPTGPAHRRQISASWDPERWRNGDPKLAAVRTGHPFTSDPIHTIPVDAPAVPNSTGARRTNSAPTPDATGQQKHPAEVARPVSVDRPIAFQAGGQWAAAPGSPRVNTGTKPPLFPSGLAPPSWTAATQQQSSAAATLQQQAAVLADLIATRSASVSTVEELAQLNMARQLLSVVTTAGGMPLASGGLPTSSAGLLLGAVASQLGMPMPAPGASSRAGMPSANAHGGPNPAALINAATASLPNLPNTLL